MNSRLYLETEVRDKKTYIKDVFFKAPYKIMSPFTDEKTGGIQIMLMSASAGLLAGDIFESDLVFGKDSKVKYTSQSYDKVFNTKDKFAQKDVKITVKAGAKVKYMPYPVIPFKNSNFKSHVQVQLDETASFVYCDIFTCGRSGMGEYFEMKKTDSYLKVCVGDKLAFADHTLIEPRKFPYNSMGLWQDYTHNGMMYIYVSDKDKEKELISVIRQKKNEEENILLGASNAENGIIVRLMAMSGEKIYNIFNEISGVV